MRTDREAEDARRIRRRMAREYESDYSGIRPRLRKKKRPWRGKRRWLRRIFFTLLATGAVGAVVWFGWQYISESQPDMARQLQPLIDSSADYFDTAQERVMAAWQAINTSGASKASLPASGVMMSDPKARDALTGLAVRVPEGSTHYFVKVLRVSDKNTVATLFVRAGEKGYVALLPGKYQLAWTSGRSWHGFDDLFGFWGTFEVGSTLEVTEDQGWTIDMQKTMFSDYVTFPMSESAFRK